LTVLHFLALCAGEAASKGVQSAAKLTLDLGVGAVKAATPVGKWMLQQSAKAAVAVVKRALSNDKNKRG
jgi:hypothetical protein